MSNIISLPDHARLWLFCTARPLADSEIGALREFLEQTIVDWRSHGTPVQAAYEIYGRRFILVGGNVDSAGPSGCSIDTLFRSMRSIGQSAEIDFIDAATDVFFREAGEITSVSRDRFAELCRSGAITPETMVFDNSVSTVQQIKEGFWELPFKRSWHARLFALEPRA